MAYVKCLKLLQAFTFCLLRVSLKIFTLFSTKKILALITKSFSPQGNKHKESADKQRFSMYIVVK